LPRLVTVWKKWCSGGSSCLLDFAEILPWYSPRYVMKLTTTCTHVVIVEKLFPSNALMRAAVSIVSKGRT
jgi:hypothetical protein